MNRLTYKGYTGEVEYEADAGILYGHVIDLRDGITFESESATEIVKEFHISVDEYLAFCAEQGVEPDKPYSGKWLFRTTPERHRAIALAAARAGKSINTWMDDVLYAATHAAETDAAGEPKRDAFAAD